MADITDLINLSIESLSFSSVKLFKASTCGYPGCFENEKEWGVILDKMILAFERTIECDGGPSKFEDEIDEGLKLFGKYYRGLWW